MCVHADVYTWAINAIIYALARPKSVAKRLAAAEAATTTMHVNEERQRERIARPNRWRLRRVHPRPFLLPASRSRSLWLVQTGLKSSLSPLPFMASP